MVHLTTVHPRSDTRINVKEASTLAGWRADEVILMVADGKGSEKDGNVVIQDFGKLAGGRLGRAVFGPIKAFKKIRALKPEVVHFHDPGLIPVGLLLKLFGCKVVYDVHEDVPRQILNKQWIPSLLRRPTAWAMERLEWVGAEAFDAIVPATPKIAERFPAQKTVVVQNFPILEELITPDPVPYAERPPHFAYVGGITGIRGAREMVQAVGLMSGPSARRLELAGGFTPAQLEYELQQMSGWSRVCFHGLASRSEVAKILGSVRAGLVVLHPTRNYPDAYPVKMFEYMAAGLPVIASDFPLWRHIVEQADCGLLVEPLDPQAIAEAMLWVLHHPEEAEAMGQHGRMAVEKTYNWEREGTKLIGLYETLLGEKTRNPEA